MVAGPMVDPAGPIQGQRLVIFLLGDNRWRVWPKRLVASTGWWPGNVAGQYGDLRCDGFVKPCMTVVQMRAGQSGLCWHPGLMTESSE